jgi:hypothetical protein
VVLGMHKSGTSLIAATLHAAGIAMLDGNEPDPHVERASTRALNNAVLAMADGHSLSIATPLSPARLQPQHRNAARRLLSALAAASPSQAAPPSPTPAWGFKDPRTLLTYRALWEPLLSDPCLVGIVRHPAAVFAHYRRHHALHRPRSLGRLLWQCLSVWLAHNRELLAIQQCHPQMLLLDTSAFLASDAGLHALARHVGRPLPDCRRLELQRSQPRRTALYQLARLIARLRQGQDPEALYAALQRLAVP